MLNDQKKTTWYTEYCVQEIKNEKKRKSSPVSRLLWHPAVVCPHHLTATESPLIDQMAFVPPSLFRSRGSLLPQRGPDGEDTRTG
jgi:hypothetical protein